VQLIFICKSDLARIDSGYNPPYIFTAILYRCITCFTRQGSINSSSYLSFISHNTDSYRRL